MNRLLKTARIESMGEAKPIRTKLTLLSLNDEPTSGGFGLRRKYALKLELQSLFWASDAEMENARRQAEKLLLQTLHEDILICATQLRSAVFNDDRDEALRIIDQIQSAVGL